MYAASLLLALAPASQAHAEVEVGLAAGYHVFSPNNELGVRDGENADALGDSVLFGARIGYIINSVLGLELEGAFMPASFEDSDVSATVLSYRLNALVQFGAKDPAHAFIPFILVGGGLNSTVGVEDGHPNLGDDQDSSLHAGVGAKYRFGGGWGARLDVRALLVPSTRLNEDDPSTDRFAVDYEGMVSIYKSFGGPKAKAAVAEPAPATEPCVGPGCPGYVEPAPAENPDPDGDGFIGDADACPQEAEDVNGLEDNDGCPDAMRDTDNDGITDVYDKCINEPETVNGYQDTDGCKDEVPQEVQKFSGRIDGIAFATGSAKITKASFKTLGAAAKVLADHPDLRIEIGGHTDDKGDDDRNQALSQARADAVRDYLISKGVDASRLEAKGYGETMPVADNAKAAGRAKNRRVEFTLK